MQWIPRFGAKVDLKGYTSNLRPPNFAGVKKVDIISFGLFMENSLLLLQLQAILRGSKALIGIDETRKAERLRGALRKSVRASGFNCNNNANIWWWTTAFTHRACYGRLWDDIHLSGHFTCRLASLRLEQSGSFC